MDSSRPFKTDLITVHHINIEQLLAKLSGPKIGDIYIIRVLTAPKMLWVLIRIALLKENQIGIPTRYVLVQNQQKLS